MRLRKTWFLPGLNQTHSTLLGFAGGAVVKSPPASAGDAREESLIPVLQSSPGGGSGTHSSLPAWRIPRTKEPGGLQSTGSHRVGRDRARAPATLFQEASSQLQVPFSCLFLLLPSCSESLSCRPRSEFWKAPLPTELIWTAWLLRDYKKLGEDEFLWTGWIHIWIGYHCLVEHREDESGLRILPTAVQVPEGDVWKGQASGRHATCWPGFWPYTRCCLPIWYAGWDHEWAGSPLLLRSCEDLSSTHPVCFFLFNTLKTFKAWVSSQVRESGVQHRIKKKKW